MQKRKPILGDVVWRDLTVPDANRLRDFYSAVVGWSCDEVDMGGYVDYAMRPREGKTPVAGVCHRRGVNAKIPPQWLVYVLVESLDDSLTAARRRGGRIVDGPRPMGEHDFAVIRDPAGAHIGLLARHTPVKARRRRRPARGGSGR